MTSFFPELPKLDKLFSALSELGLNPHDGAGYELTKLRRYRDALFENFAPFKVGDLVVMHTAFPIPKGSGWYGRDEMMQPGATGLVREVDWTAQEVFDKEASPGEGFFSILVRFDREWYVYEGRRYDEEDGQPHVFHFGNPERYWRKQEADELEDDEAA